MVRIKTGIYYLMVVWVVWSEVSYFGFYFFEMDWVHVVGVSDVPVACLIMSLYCLHVGCLWWGGGGFQPVAGGGPLVKFLRIFSDGLLRGTFR